MNKPRHGLAVLGYFNSQNAGDDAFHDYWTRSMAAPGMVIADDFRGSTAERAVLGGGAIINDYFLKRLPDSFKNLSLVSCSLPYGDNDLALLNEYRDQIDLMYLRSMADAKAACARGFEAKYVPDIIFSHEFREEPAYDLCQLLEFCSLQPLNFDPQKKNLIAFLSDHYFSEELERFLHYESFKYRLADALDYASDFYNIIFIPMSIWYDARDNKYAAEVASRMRKKTNVVIVDRYLGPDAIFSLTKQYASVVVSMKYHGLIFAMRANIPFINLGDTRKNLDLLKDTHLEILDCNVSKFSKESFSEALKLCESDKTTGMISNIVVANQQLLKHAEVQIARTVGAR